MKKFAVALLVTGLSVFANFAVASEEFDEESVETTEVSVEEQCRQQAEAEGVSEEEMETYISECVESQEEGGESEEEEE